MRVIEKKNHILVIIFFKLFSVEFNVPTTVFGERPYLSGGLLGDFYEAMAVHFHWGSPQQKGSEHLLNGRRYDLEMHIVHRNTRYQSDEEARNQTDGLAVLAVLFKVVRVSSAICNLNEDHLQPRHFVVRPITHSISLV